MVSVSQLISDIEGVTGTRFKESLGVINNYAKKDRLLTVCENRKIYLFIFIAVKLTF